MLTDKGVHCLNRALGLGIGISVGALFVMFYPGGMSIDSYNQLEQARVGVFDDWHPPFMGWLWGVMDLVVRGPLLMVVAQFALFLIGLRTFARAAVGGNDTVVRLFVLLTLWIAPITGILGTVWKDVWMSCLLLLAAGLILSIGGTSRSAVRYRLFLLGSLAILGALLFRHNAVFAAVPLLSYGGWELVGARSGVRRAFASIAVGVLGAAALFGASGGINLALTTYRHYPTQSILIFDIAGVSVLAGRSDLLDTTEAGFTDVLRGQRTVSLEALRRHYSPQTWTPLVFEEGSPLSRTQSAAQVDQLAAAWRRAVLEEPSAYLRHRASVFRQVLGAHNEWLFAPVYFGIPKSSPDYAVALRYHQIVSEHVSPTQQMLRDQFTRATLLIIYRPWLWLGLSLFLTVVAGVLSPRRAALVAVASSGLLYELALFFIAPSADFRYSHWLILSTWGLMAALAADAVPRLAARVRNVGRPVS